MFLEDNCVCVGSPLSVLGSLCFRVFGRLGVAPVDVFLVRPLLVGSGRSFGWVPCLGSGCSRLTATSTFCRPIPPHAFVLFVLLEKK